MMIRPVEKRLYERPTSGVLLQWRQPYNLNTNFKAAVITPQSTFLKLSHDILLVADEEGISVSYGKHRASHLLYHITGLYRKGRAESTKKLLAKLAAFAGFCQCTTEMG